MLKFIPYKSISIKYKFLFSTFLFVAVFTIMLVYFWHSTTKKDAEISAISYMNEIFNVSNETLEVSLKDINSIISVLSLNTSDNKFLIDILKKDKSSSELEQYTDSKEITELLTKLSINKYYLNGIIVSNLNDIYFSTGITMPIDELKSQPWYNKIIHSHGEKIFIPPHPYSSFTSNVSTREYKDMVLSYAKAILDDGVVIGFVIADIRCELLTDIYKRNMKDNGYIFIADSRFKELIYSPTTNSIPMFNNKSELTKILDKASQLNGSFYLKNLGKNYFFVYSKSSYTGWITLGVIPEYNLLSSFYKARNNLFILTSIFCIFAFAILFFICTILTKNILRLNKAVSKISKDNLEFSINITSNDEVGKLYIQINSMLDRMKNLIENNKEIEKEKVSAEIKFLQSQINPHFLYNTLNTIKFISALHGVENIIKISESLSKLLHLNMDGRVFISVGEEVEYIKSYLSIQEFKYNNLVYNIILEENVVELMTLKLLLQPIVENSLIHGINAKEGQSIINIKIYRDSETLKMRIQDNGCGMSTETISNILENRIHSKGIGLSNVISRIKLYFGDNYGLNIISQPDLFTVMEIALPAISKDEVKNYA